MRLEASPQATESRSEALNAYLSTNVLAGSEFLCGYYRSCQESHPHAFYEGQLHHVGKYYDLSADGRPYRLMIVGQEYGHPDRHVDLEQRYKMIMKCGHDWRFKADGVHKPRNPHMKGTTSVLRLLLGIPPGADHAAEFVSVNGTDQSHLFDAFALVNFLLCSAVAEETGKRGRSTITMRENCRAHFREAIEILEPTVVIMQGISFWPFVEQAFDSVARIADRIYRARIGVRSTLVAAFSHPSAPYPNNWGLNAKTPYLLNVVQPTIAEIRRITLGFG